MDMMRTRRRKIRMMTNDDGDDVHMRIRMDMMMKIRMDMKIDDDK